jgi:hypothetical protein
VHFQKGIDRLNVVAVFGLGRLIERILMGDVDIRVSDLVRAIIVDGRRRRNWRVIGDKAGIDIDCLNSVGTDSAVGSISFSARPVGSGLGHFSFGMGLVVTVNILSLTPLTRALAVASHLGCTAWLTSLRYAATFALTAAAVLTLGAKVEGCVMTGKRVATGRSNINVSVSCLASCSSNTTSCTCTLTYTLPKLCPHSEHEKGFSFV